MKLFLSTTLFALATISVSAATQIKGVTVLDDNSVYIHTEKGTVEVGPVDLAEAEFGCRTCEIPSSQRTQEVSCKPTEASGQRGSRTIGHP